MTYLEIRRNLMGPEGSGKMNTFRCRDDNCEKTALSSYEKMNSPSGKFQRSLSSVMIGRGLWVTLLKQRMQIAIILYSEGEGIVIIGTF